MRRCTVMVGMSLVAATACAQEKAPPRPQAASPEAAAAVTTQASDPSLLVGFWEFSGATYVNSSGEERTQPVDGDVDLRADGTSSGVRMIGSIAGPLEGGYEVNGNQFRFKDEDTVYTWSVTPSEYEGQPVWVLTLQAEDLTYRLLRRRQ